MATGRHLTEDELSAWVAGERGPAVLRHLSCCSACQAEALLLETTLLGFRGAVREWSREYETSAVMPPAAAVDSAFFTFNRACLAMAVAIVCVLLGVSLRPGNSARRPGNSLTDRALMSQVDDQISRTVPSAMEPLLDLVAWQGDGHVDAVDGAGSAPGNENRQGAAY